MMTTDKKTTVNVRLGDRSTRTVEIQATDPGYAYITVRLTLEEARNIQAQLGKLIARLEEGAS